MRPLRFLFCLLPSLLASCCANDRCDCNSARADALTILFDTTSNAQPDATHFTLGELDTVYVLRYAGALNTTKPQAYNSLVHDSVALVRSLAQVSSPIYIDNATPFAAVGGRKLDAFHYRVRVQRADRQRRYADLDSIGLRGQYVGDGCCTCYRNTRKTLRVNRQVVNARASDGTPNPVKLSRN